MLATRLDRVSRKLSRKIINAFTAASGLIGMSPIPLSDLYILLAIQSVMVMLVAYLAGSDISFKTAQKIIVSLGGNGLAGLAFRVLAQQSAKALNVIAPGAGSVAGGGIAAAATYGMGEAAIRYYFDGILSENLRQVYEKASQDHKEDKYCSEDKS